MAAFNVTPAQLKSLASELEQLNSQFKSAVGNLEQTEQNLGTMWEGEAKNAFRSAFQRDKSNMDLFHANILKFVAALNTMAAKYEQAENANVSTGTQRSY